jgi:4Fe-4S ferredoxin
MASYLPISSIKIPREKELPLRLQKTESGNQLLIERIHHARRYKLVIDKDLCVGCDICKTVCPKEAIRITKAEKKPWEKAQKPTVEVDLEKCHFCGVCNSICPFGAIKVLIDDKNILSVVEKGSFPELVREMEINPNKCDSASLKYEKACPLNLITVTFHVPDGKEIKNPDELTQEEKENLKAEVNVKRERCPCCRICELKGPTNAILVKPIFSGTLKINEDKCPKGCRDCLDVCPIKGALYLSEDETKVRVNETFCVYCGACRNVCPVEGALELQRMGVRHTMVKSGAWNKALEKLASTKEISKELRAKGAVKAKEMVDRRFELGRQQQ